MSAASVPGLVEPHHVSSAMRWADLRLRVLSAAILAPLAIACLWLGGWPWLGLVLVAATGLGLEWLALCGQSPSSSAAVALLAAILAAVLVAADGGGVLALALLAGGSLMVWLLRRQRRLAAGVAYVGLAAAALVWLRADPLVGRANLLFLVLIVWCSDIGAYAVGRLVGGPRLAAAISPGKTWSGAVGGLLAAIAAGWLAARATTPQPPGGSLGAGALAVAAALSIVSQAGDLLESAIKRRFGVKDSSHLIPGHGGLLDRLDGMLTTAPVAGLLALALGRGVVLWQ